MRGTGVLVALAALLAACGDGPTEPPSATGERLVIAPGALLLAEAGATAELKAFSIDADGDSTPVAASFTSSAPGIVAVTGDGVATGGPALGSAQIVATSGDLTSDPILALRAAPAAGALLVADSQVIGEVEALDPDAPYGPGRQLRVRLRRGTPAVGQIVLATGTAPIGGRVVTVTGGPDVVDVVFEVTSLQDLFQDISIAARLPLTLAATSASQNRHGIRLFRSPGGGTGFAAPSGARFNATAVRTSLHGGAIDQEFELGPFKCKMEVPAPISVPISMSTFSGDLNESLALDLIVEDGAVRRFVVDGTIRPTLTVAPRISAALEGKAECRYMVREFPLPVGGFLSLFFGGQVPVGIGFEIAAKTTLGQLGADVTFQSVVTTRLGFDCSGACEWVHGFDAAAPDITVKPVIPDLGTSTRVELGASAFAWAELTLGLTLWNDETTRLKLLAAKGGMEQKFELASAEAQAADPAYASSYSLKPAVEVKAGAEYTPLENLLQVTLTLFTYSPDFDPLSRSPRGTFAIAPPTVRPGDDVALGERATFTVTLTDAQFLGAYSVEAVQIRWRRTFGETVLLESGRPGCTDLEAAEGQLTFTCETDFLAEHEGAQTFHAFVKTRIFGVPIPIPLEVAADARATVTVQSPSSGATITLGWGGEPMGGEIRLYSADRSTAGGQTCNVLYQPIPVPPVSSASTCQLSGASANGSWTTDISAPAGGPVTLTVSGVINMSQAASIDGSAWESFASSALSAYFTVSGGTAQYELNGSVQVGGYQGSAWNLDAMVVFNSSQGPIISALAGGCHRLEGCAPATVPLSGSGAIAPGIYSIGGILRAGTGSITTDARSSTAQYTYQLILRP